jgi:LemA protein
MGWAIAIAVVVVAVWLYNRLVSLRNRVRNAWSQIDVQLKRRTDLIPNLVASVKGYMAHEKGIFEALTRARENALAAGDDVARRAQAEGELGRTLKSLFALAESNPQLRASETMASFQEELSSTENRIAFARQHYNDSVLAYNNAVQTVPSNVVARVFSFAEEPLFQLETEEERRPVAVAF